LQDKISRPIKEYAKNHLVLLATHDKELMQLLDAEIYEMVDPSLITAITR